MIEKKHDKKTFWTILMFYLLIGFEIIYMISPFGIYYYSIYGKGLNFLIDNSITSWLGSFFLPHIVETSSFILNIYKDIGWTLAVIGFLAFLAGAGQIYLNKLSKKSAVTGGIYKYIRHPQYISLAICSFGLLLVWPRYLVLITFIMMLFAYYFLAKVEEKECEEKFGKSYTDYLNITNMFLPFSIPFADKLHGLPKSGITRKLAIVTLFILVLSGSIYLADGLQKYSIEKLYTSYSDNSATISITEMEQDDMDKIVEIALSDIEVQNKLESVKEGSNTIFLIYVLPDEWYFSDIPMNMPEGDVVGHHIQLAGNENCYKVLINKADLKPGKDAEGKEIIMQTVKINPIVEVRIDLTQNEVIGIENPPKTVRWGDIPTPLF